MTSLGKRRPVEIDSEDTQADFRLYVSGLNPLIKLKDLTERFQSFGEIVEDERDDKVLGLDANGNPRTFAFLTLNTTSKQIKKCTSMLSGSMWKGHKLKIQLAKPDYYSKMAAEREELANGLLITTAPRKKRKMNLKPSTIGSQSKHFELINLTNVHLHPGWLLDTTTTPPTPIYPILTRPTHSIPLPPSTKAITSSWTRETPKAKAAKEAKKLKKLRQGILPNLLVKAFRLKIDPRRWGRKKLIFDRDAVMKGFSSAGIKGNWECLEPESVEENVEGREGDIQWVFKTRDGIIRRKEIVRMSKRNKPHTDSFKALLDALDATPSIRNIATASVDPIVPVSNVIVAESIESIVAEEEEPFISAFSPEPSPSLSTTSSNLPPIPSNSSSPLFPLTQAIPRPRSISPPNYISLPPRSLIYNEEDSFALLTSIEDSTEALETRRLERLGQLGVLGNLLSSAAEGEEVQVEERSERIGKPEVEGFGEEEDDFFASHVNPRGENVNTGGKRLEVLRLRGGGPVGSKDEADEDDKMEVEQVPVKKEKTSLQMNSLKDMFKPQEEESTSFSIFSSLDLDISEDPTARSPSPPAISYPSNTQLYSTVPSIMDKSTMTPFQLAQQAHSDRHGFVPPTALGTRGRNWIGMGPITKFFPFSEERLSKEDLMGVGMELSEEKFEELKRVAREEEERRKEVEGFWRKESLEKITAVHSALQESLRGLARKRHREVSKRVRKKGEGKIRITGGGGGGELDVVE